MRVTRVLAATLLLIAIGLVANIFRTSNATNTKAPWLVGQSCPDWLVSTSAGNSRPIGDFVTSKPLVVILGSQKCASCVELLTALAPLLDDITKKADVLMLEWPNSDPASADVPLPMDLQPHAVADASRIQGYILPTILVIDSQRNVVFDQRGWHPELWQIISGVLDSFW